MTRNKILSLLVVLLLVINAGLLVYFLKFKRPGERHDGGRPRMSDIVKKELGLSDDQAAKFQEMRKSHFENLRVHFDEIRTLKEALLKTLSGGAAQDSLVNSLTQKIGEKQALIEAENFRHFKTMRSLCTPEQQPKFDSLMARMMRKMNRGPFRGGDEKDEKK